MRHSGAVKSSTSPVDSLSLAPTSPVATAATSTQAADPLHRADFRHDGFTGDDGGCIDPPVGIRMTAMAASGNGEENGLGSRRFPDSRRIGDDDETV